MVDPMQKQRVKNLHSVGSLFLVGAHHFELGCWFDLWMGPRVSYAGMGWITSMSQLLIRGQVQLL